MSQRTAERADEYVPGHGDLRFDVRSYALTLRYGVEDNRLVGRAVLRCRVAKDTDRLVLDLSRLSVSKVTVDGVRPAKYTHRGGRLEIRLQRPATTGDELTVAVSYSGHPAPVGGPLGEAGWEELADGVIVAAQPHGAPSWFPCNDRPSDKASYVVELTVPTAYHVLCNGVLVEQRRGASATTWRYEQSEPMATYLATVQIGRYTVRRLADEPVPVDIVFPDAIRDRSDGPFARQGEMMALFVRLFGDYPFAAPYRSVVTEDDLEIPLEAQGLSIFGANFLEDEWPSERLVAHELSHQWFGNSLTDPELARHLDARGVRLLQRVALVGGVGARVRRRPGARALEAARRPAAGPAARRPRTRRHVRRPGLQAGSPAPARAAADAGRRRVLRVPADVGGGAPPRLRRPRRAHRAGRGGRRRATARTC